MDGKTLIPFSILVPVHPVPFLVPFPYFPGKTKTVRIKWYTVADGTGFIPSVFILKRSKLLTKGIEAFKKAAKSLYTKSQRVVPVSGWYFDLFFNC